MMKLFSWGYVYMLMVPTGTNMNEEFYGIEGAEQRMMECPTCCWSLRRSVGRVSNRNSRCGSCSYKMI